jgi:hypothetical protein
MCVTYLDISCMSHMLFRVRWRAGSHVLFCARLHTLSSRVARISRVDHVCRVASTHDNKLFLLINTYVNNVNSSGRVF